MPAAAAAPLLPFDQEAADLTAALAPAASPMAVSVHSMEVPVEVPAAKAQSAPALAPLPERLPVQLEGVEADEPTSLDFAQPTAGLSTGEAQAGNDAADGWLELSKAAKPASEERSPETRSGGRLAEPGGADDGAGLVANPQTAHDASSEALVQLRTPNPKTEHADRGAAEPVPPQLPDGGPTLNPSLVRSSPVADPSAAAQGPIATPSITLPSADHRGRVVSARLVLSQEDGGSSVRIDLEPADLGRVEVALRVDDAGLASAIFTVDRPETLQLLQRDARAVGELLGSAGFTVQQGALGFTLRDSPGGQQGFERGERSGRRASVRGGLAAPARPFTSPRGLLDLRV
ncbi:MAG: flagellar hook-length control protein FliK [Geminicoccaceae bacterium]